MPARKIATCCYCGTRAVLVLRGKERHELSCSSCGAPLHDLKMLPIGPERGVSLCRRSHPPSTQSRAPKAAASEVKNVRNAKGCSDILLQKYGMKSKVFLIETFVHARFTRQRGGYFSAHQWAK